MVSKRIRATALAAVACAPMQQQCVWGFALPSPVHHVLELPPQAMSTEFPLSRAQLLQLLPPGIVGAVAFGAVVSPSSAALPTAEDYAFGTGSKVKRCDMLFIDSLQAER